MLIVSILYFFLDNHSISLTDSRFLIFS